MVFSSLLLPSKQRSWRDHLRRLEFRGFLFQRRLGVTFISKSSSCAFHLGHNWQVPIHLCRASQKSIDSNDLLGKSRGSLFEAHHWRGSLVVWWFVAAGRWCFGWSRGRLLDKISRLVLIGMVLLGFFSTGYMFSFSSKMISEISGMMFYCTQRLFANFFFGCFGSSPFFIGLFPRKPPSSATCGVRAEVAPPPRCFRSGSPKKVGPVASAWCSPLLF